MKNKALLAYLAVCFFWGSTYLAIKIGVADIPPMFFAGTRFVIAGGIMLLYGKFKNKEFPKKRSSIIKMSIVGFLMLLGANGLIVYAEQWVDSGIASVIVATMPIFIAILEKLFIKDVNISKRGYLGLLLGFLGVYLLISPGKVNTVIQIEYLGIILFATFLWSAGSIYSKMIEEDGSIINNIGIQMLAGGLGLLIISIITGEIGRLTFSVNGILAMGYLIIFGSIVGYSSYIYVLSKWPATKAGTYAYVNPIVAIILGNLILKEAVTFTMVLSMILILLGVFIVQNSKIKI